MNREQGDRVEWVGVDGGAEELHVGGCWARVSRGESVIGRDGERAQVFYWSAGAEGRGPLIHGAGNKQERARRRALRALMLCFNVASWARLRLPKEGGPT